MTILLLVSTLFAHAADLHTGIPVRGIEGLGEPAFQTTATGWSAPVTDGFVRVFVGRSEQEAIEWVGRMRESLSRYKPEANEDFLTTSGADEAYGNGLSLIIFRDGNVGCMVRHKEDVLPWAKALEDSIVDNGTAWPSAPKLKSSGDVWVVQEQQNTAHISFEGGKMALRPTLAFREKPSTLIRWDIWGRSSKEVIEQE
ncbi:MAG: hypothetical protein ACPGTU_14445 [Myxococcota bacterium]